MKYNLVLNNLLKILKFLTFKVCIFCKNISNIFTFFIEPIEDDFGELKQKFEILNGFREIDHRLFNAIFGMN